MPPARAVPAAPRPAAAVAGAPGGRDWFAESGLRVSPDPGYQGQCQFHGRHSRCSNRAILMLRINGAAAAACESCALVVDRGATSRGYAFRAALTITAIGPAR